MAPSIQPAVRVGCCSHLIMKETPRPPTPRFIAPFENCTDEEPFLHAVSWFIPVWKVTRDEENQVTTRTQFYYSFGDDKFVSFNNFHEDKRIERYMRTALKLQQELRAQRAKQQRVTFR